MNLFLRACALSLSLAATGCVGYDMYSGNGGYQGGHRSSAGHGGYRAPARGGDRGWAQQGVVRCESRDRRRNYCAMETRGGVRMARQLSDARCIQGSSWGYDGRGVWVADGCRADFISGQSSGGGMVARPGRVQGAGQLVRCESDKNRHQRCNINVARDVRLERQLSKTRCVQRQNWGWDRGGIWVNGGCRADFRVN